MLIIIYTKQPQKLEDWAQLNRSAEKTIFIRDMRGFVPADIEPCDEVWMTEESAALRKAYRPDKLKLFDPAEVKQTPAPKKTVRSRRKRAS